MVPFSSDCQFFSFGVTNFCFFIAEPITAEAERSSGILTHGTGNSDGDSSTDHSAASASSASSNNQGYDSTVSSGTDQSGSVESDHVNVSSVQCTEANQLRLRELTSAGLITMCSSAFEYNYQHLAKFESYKGLSTTWL